MHRLIAFALALTCSVAVAQQQIVIHSDVVIAVDYPQGHPVYPTYYAVGSYPTEYPVYQTQPVEYLPADGFASQSVQSVTYVHPKAELPKTIAKSSPVASTTKAQVQTTLRPPQPVTLPMASPFRSSPFS
ncbi:MAG: hypothetical protein AAF497_19745, partial [Planctomycetota bacterium]